MSSFRLTEFEQYERSEYVGDFPPPLRGAKAEQAGSIYTGLGRPRIGQIMIDSTLFALALFGNTESPYFANWLGSL